MPEVGFVIIPKRSMGALDAFVPVISRIRAEVKLRTVIDTVVMNKAIDAMINSSAFHRLVFTEFTNCVRLDHSGRFVGRIRNLGKLTAVLVFRRMTCRRLVILSNMTGRGWGERQLARLLDAIGSHFWFPTNPMSQTEEFARRFSSDRWAVLLKQGAKTREATRIRARQAICYTDSEIELQQAQFSGSTRFETIGIPRLYSGWKEFVARFGEQLVAQELSSRGLDPRSHGIVVIVVPAPDYFWFNDANDCFRMVVEAIERIRHKFADLPIAVKVKPQHMGRFAKALPDLNQGAFLTTLGLTALASCARFAVGIQETSGIFEFLAAEVPVIEYGQYSSEWRKVCSGGSAYRDLPGVAHVESTVDLEQAIQAIADGSCELPTREALAARLRNRDRFNQVLMQSPGREVS